MVRKYSYDFKMYLVRAVRYDGRTILSLSKEHKIPRNTIYTILNKYRINGSSSLKHTYTRNDYSREFKLSVLYYKLTNNLTYEQTALHFDIPSPSVIHSWYKLYKDELENNNIVTNNTNKTITNIIAPELSK